ncbi:helix-turn-helix transcriptional regulator [Xiamenia xianingshaonis]|uniref:Helix-turn-helix domain-containing protein n=1 Tax=Xiamenia xianingshaonis TaxID=2682776 RepID=A0A9E6SUX0_9ACTN|nr:helix-turn-helix domain-containing protein [Xiamenia xianingshaonis]NHM14464.1 hypothetical protein [Xiamenia xianingshaonis]QTU84938.1 helix-turn-helix domain-containing protein [Xiamenia xianingshaonis]
MTRRMLDANEYAEVMGLHPQSVRRMLVNGQIPQAEKLGGTRWRIPYDDAEKPSEADMRAEAARNLLASLRSACATVSTAVAEYEQAVKV